MSESVDGRSLAESTLKQLTGGDTITVRRLYGQLVTFEPSHTTVLYLPRVRGGDPALWARLVVVPFEVTIPPDEQDPELAERLQREADAVLAWAVAGYSAYRAQGLNSPAGGVGDQGVPIGLRRLVAVGCRAVHHDQPGDCR